MILETQSHKQKQRGGGGGGSTHFTDFWEKGGSGLFLV